MQFYACPGNTKGNKMRKERLNILTLTSIALVLFAVVSCNSPAEPGSEPTPGGRVIAWFNGMSYTVDLYFPESDSLVTNAYITGDIPNDILSHEDGYIAVLNSTSANVQVFDLESTGGELFHIDFPAGCNPYTMSWNGNNLWVTLLMTSQVAKVNLTAGGSVTLFPVKANPTSIAVTENRVLVGHGNYPESSVTGGITVLDASTGNVIDSISTPDNVCFMRYFSETGLVHAISSTYTGDGKISLVDPASATILAQISTGGSPGYPVRIGSGFTAGDTWWSDAIFFYDEAGTLLDTWNAGINATGLAVSGDTLYITDFGADKVYIADWESRTILDSLAVGDGPQGIIAVER